MAIIDSSGERKNPRIQRGLVASSIRFPGLALQEEVIIEAVSPTRGAVMLQDMQQRQRAVVAKIFMTDANLVAVLFEVKCVRVLY